MKFLWGSGKTSVSISGPIWNFPSRKVLQSEVWLAVSLQLTARFSCPVTFARLFSWWQPCPLSALGLLTEFPLPVFSSCIYRHLLYFLGIIRHPSKAHIYQGSQHAIAHPCHKSQCPTPPLDKSNCECINPLINVLFACFVSCFPGRLRSASFFSGEQSQSPSWLRGDFRPGAEKPSSAAASLSLNFRFLAVALLKLIVSGLTVSWHQHRRNEALPERYHQLIPWELAVPTLLSVLVRTERIYQ